MKKPTSIYEDFPNGIESRQIKLALYSYVGQSHALNGKVIGEFMCDRIDKFTVGSLGCDDIERLACLTYREMLDYFYKPNELDGKTVKFGYGWHISDLKIYDKPKELWHFLPPCNSDGKCFKCRHYDYFIDPTIDAHCRQMERDIERPPMSWCYVEELWGV